MSLHPGEATLILWRRRQRIRTATQAVIFALLGIGSLALFIAFPQFGWIVFSLFVAGTLSGAIAWFVNHVLNYVIRPAKQ